MNPMAIWYHSRFDGGEPPIETDHALNVLCEQMNALEQSSLLQAASVFQCGIICNLENLVVARSLIPAKAEITHFMHPFCSELPTLGELRDWLPGHEDWNVLYLHGKGVRHPNDPLTTVWRQCMTRHLVFNWQNCVRDLETGHFDAVGCHWLTREKHGAAVKTPFFGGNFFWAKGAFLKTLPELPRTAANRDDFYKAESWIGSGPREPRVLDYAPHWPGLKECAA